MIGQAPACARDGHQPRGLSALRSSSANRCALPHGQPPARMTQRKHLVAAVRTLVCTDRSQSRAQPAVQLRAHRWLRSQAFKTRPMNSYLRNLSIGTRLGVGFAAILVLICLLTAFISLQLSDARQLAQQSVLAQTELSNLTRDWRQGIAVNGQRALAIVVSGDDAVAREFKEPMRNQSEQINALQERVVALETTTEGRQLLDTLGSARKSYVATRATLLQARTRNDKEAVFKLIDEFRVLLAQYDGATQALSAYEDRRSSVLADQLQDRLRFVILATVSTAAACIGAAALIGWWLTQSIVKPLSRARWVAERIADSDLSSPIEPSGKDEVGQLVAALMRMQQSLRVLVGDIRQSVDSISLASREVAMGNNDLSVRTEQAAASLEETASSVEQVSGTVRQSAEAAAQADTLSRQASTIAGEGGEAVIQVVRAMQGIHESSNKITDIIGVIDGIAFQTNILALNAAVEAARAGEQGRGFAVVAAEVRSLAQRSANAAKEVKVLIEASVGRVSAGAKQAAHAGSTLDTIIASIHRVSGIVAEIASASAEQSRGIVAINSAVSSLDQQTQQNAALVEQSAAAASSLQEQAVALAAAVQRFRIN